MNILAVLPLAFVMVAGPQILSSFFFATSEGWRKTSAAYVLGSAISISLVVTAAFLLSSGASSSGASDNTIYYIVLALLLFAMLHTLPHQEDGGAAVVDGKAPDCDPQVRVQARLPAARLLPE